MTRTTAPSLCALLLAGALAAMSSPAAAGPTAANAPAPAYEFRLGVMDHDADIPITLHHGDNSQKDKLEKGVDINAEVLLLSPALFEYIFSPRPIFGFMVNTAGHTNHAYGGLAWQFDFWDRFFIEGMFGLAVHDGILHSPKDADGGECSGGPATWYCMDGRAALGSRVLFREAVELGVRFDDRSALSLHVSHISNGGMLDEANNGMNFVGLRYGYRFDLP